MFSSLIKSKLTKLKYGDLNDMSEKITAIWLGFIIVLGLIILGMLHPNNPAIINLIKDLCLLILGGIYGAAQE